MLYESEAALRLVDQGLRDMHDVRIDRQRTDTLPAVLAHVQRDVLDALNEVREQLVTPLSSLALLVALGDPERGHETGQRCRRAAGVLDEISGRLLDVAHSVDATATSRADALTRRSDEIFPGI